MAAGLPLLGPRPLVNTGGVVVNSPIVWDWLNDTYQNGDNVCIAFNDPFGWWDGGENPNYGGDGPPDHIVTDNKEWCRTFGRDEVLTITAPIWIWCVPKAYGTDHFAFHDNENNIRPLYATNTKKFRGITLNPNNQFDPITPVYQITGSSWHRDDWTVFVVAVGIIASVIAFAPAVGAVPTTPAEATPIVSDVADVVVSPIVEGGITTAPLPAVPAADWTFFTGAKAIGVAALDTAKTINTVAGAASAVGAVVAAVNGPVQAAVPAPAPAPAPAPTPAGIADSLTKIDPKIWMVVGALILMGN